MTLVLLLLLLGPPAPFWFPMPGAGEVVTVEGRWFNLEYGGVFVLEGENGNDTPACASGLRSFRCAVTAGPLTQFTITYTAHQPARCSAAPRLDVLVDGRRYATLVGPERPAHCLYLPL